MLKSVNDFGFSYFNFTIQNFIEEGNVIQLGNPLLRIDLLTEIDGVKFEDCFQSRKDVQIDGLVVKFIGFNDLIKIKKKQVD